MPWSKYACARRLGVDTGWCNRLKPVSKASRDAFAADGAPCAGIPTSRQTQKSVCAMRGDMGFRERPTRESASGEGRCCAILLAGRFGRHLPGASSDLQTDIERRRVTLRVLHRNDQQLAAAIAKKEIVGVAHRASSSRRVGFERVDAIGQRVVEV